MPFRNSQVNVPTEIVRTVVTVHETGSLTKAATVLGISQPAISIHVKRIESLLGGPIFLKTPNGSQATELGLLVLQQARKMLEANDQMLAIGGFARGDRPLRLGISTMLVRPFLQSQAPATLSSLQMQSDRSVHLAQRFLEGHIDIVCLIDVGNQNFGDLKPFVVRADTDRMVWVRSHQLSLLPGAPVPIVTWTGGDWMTRLLVSHGLAYRMVFSSEDYDAKRAAVEAGLGLSAVPERQVPDSLVRAEESYLPELPDVTVMLCVRPSAANSDKATVVTRELVDLFFGRSRGAESAAV
jgi:DNA-binding transcriptional LysR family regulator